MRKHSKGLLGAALIIIGVCFLCSLSCSWEIFTQGEIQKEDATIEELTELLPAVSVEILSRVPSADDIPDSVVVRLESEISHGGETVWFVEMEVGELLEGQGADPDTILVDLRP